MKEQSVQRGFPKNRHGRLCFLRPKSENGAKGKPGAVHVP